MTYRIAMKYTEFEYMLVIMGYRKTEYDNFINTIRGTSVESIQLTIARLSYVQNTLI